MTDPELPGSDDFDLSLLHMQTMDAIRAIADERAAADYAAEPDLAEFARAEAASLTQAVCDSYGVDPASHPSAPTYRSAFAKLLFAFADRDSYHSSITDGALLGQMGQLMNEVAASTGRVPGISEMAASFDMFAAHMSLMRRVMGDEVLAGLSPDDQLEFVRATLERIIQSGGQG